MSTPATSTTAPTTSPAQGQSVTPQGQTAQPQAKPQEIRKLKVKVDGNEVELPESDVIAGYQLSQVSTNRLKEASRIKQEAEQILKFGEANPEEFFKRTGKNPRQWAEEFLLRQLQIEAESPEQKKARENEEKLRKYEADEKKRKDSEIAEERKRLEQKHMQNYDQMFVKALAESGLPKTPYTIKRMAELQLINIRNKYELDSTQLAKLVREDYIKEQQALYGSVDGEQLLEMLGPDIVKKLSKAQIAKLKARTNTPAPTVQTKKPANSEGELTWEEYRRRNRRR